jgi:hypothetical protein
MNGDFDDRLVELERGGSSGLMARGLDAIAGVVNYKIRDDEVIRSVLQTLQNSES